MTLNREQIDAALDGLFGAAERGDWAGFESHFADDATLRQNIGTEQPIAAAVVGLAALMAGGMTVRYESVQRFIGERSATELHDAVFTKPDDSVVRLDACVVVEFDEAGKILRAHEYLDSGAAAALVR